MPGMHVVYSYERLCMHTHMGRPYTRMGHNIGPYAYGISHTRIGQYTHMGQNKDNAMQYSG